MTLLTVDISFCGIQDDVIECLVEHQQCVAQDLLGHRSTSDASLIETWSLCDVGQRLASLFFSDQNSVEL